MSSIFLKFFIKQNFTFNYYFYKYKFIYFYKYFKSCFFISCLIEFIFLYKTNYDYLIHDTTIKLIKIITELILYYLLIVFYFYLDAENLKKQVLNFNYKTQKLLIIQ